MKKQMKWLTSATLGCLGFTLLGFGCITAPVPASAATLFKNVDISSFVMQYGAAVRKSDDGIRFSAQMSAASYRALETLESDTVSVSYGMCITTAKYATANELNMDNIFGANAVYGTDNGKLPIVIQESSRMGRDATAFDSDPYVIYGSIIDAIPDNASQEDKNAYLQGSYIARAYIKYVETDANGTVVKTEYAFADYASGVAVDDTRGSHISNNTRSMFKVALNRVASGDDSADSLLSNYVRPVLGSVYTIDTYMDTHTGVDKLLGTQRLYSSSTATEIVDALTKDGYKGQTVSISYDASSNPVIKSVLQPNDVVISVKNSADTLTIPGGQFFYVTSNTEKFQNATKMTGLYYNDSGAPWTFSSEGTHGQVAILDANCRVIEGRDGDNGKLVNAKNPVRANSVATTLDGGLNVATNYAMNITVPVGGYAIIVPAGDQYALGRAFMRSHLTSQLYNVVELKLKGAEEALTSYVDQVDIYGDVARKVDGTVEENIYVNAGSVTVNEVITRAASGLKIVNDKGTFTLVDDISGYNVSVVSTGGLDVTKQGTYTLSMQAVSGTEIIAFTRKVTVLAADDVRVYIRERGPSTGEVFQIDAYQANNINSGNIDYAGAKVDDVSNVVRTRFTILSYGYLTNGAGSSYTGSTFDNKPLNYGIAMIVDATGKIVEIFDGTVGKYYGSKGWTCTQAEYEKEALAAFRNGSYAGGYLIIAPNNTPNNINDGGNRGSRTFLRENLVLNRYIECSKVLFTYNNSYEITREDLDIENSLGEIPV